MKRTSERFQEIHEAVMKCQSPEDYEKLVNGLIHGFVIPLPDRARAAEMKRLKEGKV